MVAGSELAGPIVQTILVRSMGRWGVEVLADRASVENVGAVVKEGQHPGVQTRSRGDGCGLLRFLFQVTAPYAGPP